MPDLVSAVAIHPLSSVRLKQTLKIRVAGKILTQFDALLELLDILICDVNIAS